MLDIVIFTLYLSGSLAFVAGSTLALGRLLGWWG